MKQNPITGAWEQNRNKPKEEEAAAPAAEKKVETKKEPKKAPAKVKPASKKGRG
jgi:hypothetical protein